MSHRGEMAARFAELPFMLTERPYTQTELMEHFGVDRKTIKRSIDALTEHSGIYEERDGRHVYYRAKGNFKPPPLTPAEVATLLLAQEAIGTTGLTAISSPFAKHARSLLTKVRASLPQSLRERMTAMISVYGSATAPAKDFADYAGTIDQLAMAAVECRSLLMSYHTLHSGETKDRKFDPYAVYFDPDGATMKVIGYDHSRKDIIPFSIDHIRALRETNEHFVRPSKFDLREFLAENCFNGIHGKPIKVRLRAYGVTACIFAERRFHRSQREIERIPPKSKRPESITIEMEVAGGRGLVRFILSWAPDVEVLSPEELRRDVTEVYRRSLERFADRE
ncbi:MAG: WYL domain-containing protein [Acidobacteria bacterium]|nr:WYL domain-containing protein [Acidobacteriota bacterium]